MKNPMVALHFRDSEGTNLQVSLPDRIGYPDWGVQIKPDGTWGIEVRKDGSSSIYGYALPGEFRKHPDGSMYVTVFDASDVNQIAKYSLGLIKLLQAHIRAVLGMDH